MDQYLNDLYLHCNLKHINTCICAVEVSMFDRHSSNVVQKFISSIGGQVCWPKESKKCSSSNWAVLSYKCLVFGSSRSNFKAIWDFLNLIWFYTY